MTPRPISPHILLLLLVVFTRHQGYTQETSDGAATQVLQFPVRLMERLGKKQAAISERLEKQTARYLDKLARREEKLRRRLAKLDSTKAKTEFGDAEEQYRSFTQKMQQASSTNPRLLAGGYLPYFDSVKTSLAFLERNPLLTGTAKKTTDQLQASLKNMNQLQDRLRQSDDIKAFVRQRREQLKQTLSQYTHLPKSITKSYQRFTKEAYYYQAQVQAYKEMINDPDKIGQKALEWLHKLPAFQDFMKKNSLLASLFRVPDNYGSPEALAGLQTRAQVQQLIAGRVGGSGPNVQAQMQEQLQAAQRQLSQLKNKINQLGSGSGDLEMPDFVPNNQKTKSFLQRLEYSTNLQTVKSNRFFPTTSDIAVNVGYKLNSKSVVGIGSSYKFGLGTGIRNIAFTHQGIGLRSYMDYKLKGSLWLTGGAEMNCRSRFDNFEALRNYSAWQQSALVGISKKYKVSKKLKGNAQVLYDALWKQQIPRGQAIVFRVGYGL